jgi:hypothetical protein
MFVPPLRRLEGDRVAEEASSLKYLRILLEAETSDSIRLLENIKDNPICSVYIDQSVPCVVVSWRRYATSTQLRYIHETILHMLERHGATKVLGDDTSLPTIHEEDQRWIVENWIPRAIAAGLKVAASKKPASHFGRISVDNIRAVIRSIAAENLLIRAFDDIDAARRWLQSVRV